MPWCDRTFMATAVCRLFRSALAFGKRERKKYDRNCSRVMTYDVTECMYRRILPTTRVALPIISFHPISHGLC